MDSYKKATIEPPVDIMTLFGKLSGVNVQLTPGASAPVLAPSQGLKNFKKKFSKIFSYQKSIFHPFYSVPLTPEQIESMPVDELVTKDLDEIVGEQIEDPSREENLEKIQKQLNLVLQLENKVQKEANRKVFDHSLNSESCHLSGV